PRLLRGHQTRQGPDNQVLALAWSPEGKILASGATDTTVRLWLADGKPLALLRGHTKPVQRLHWLSETMLASLGKDHTIQFWDVNQEKPIRTLKRMPPNGRFSPDGRLLAAPGGPNVIRFWDLNTGQRLGELVMLRGGNPDIYMVIGPTGQFRGTDPLRWTMNEMVFMVETGDRLETLLPEDFVRKYGWKNH